MADAQTLHCPNCGAPAAPDQGTCKYCQATLATVSCPKCFALMFDGAIYCPSCGARRARTEGSPRQAPCPACRHTVGTVQAATMREVVVGDAGLLECDRCHGMWVDARTFEHICADRAAQTAVLHQWSQTAKPAAAEVHYRRCVACGKLMNRVNFGKLSGTVVDVCRRHGTFLDAGELHQVVTFIQQGGLDRARERRIEELKEEEDRLRALQTQRDIRGDMSGSPVQIRIETHTWTGPDMLSLIEKIAGKKGQG